MNAIQACTLTIIYRLFSPDRPNNPDNAGNIVNLLSVRSSNLIFGDVAMKLYAGNLASTTTETNLREAFAAHGNVDSCHLAMDKSSGLSKGFGFVEMNKAEEAGAAITALHESDLGGNKIKVNESNQKKVQAPAANSKS